MSKEKRRLRYSIPLLLVIILLLFQSLPGLERKVDYPKIYLSIYSGAGKIEVGDLNTFLTSFNNNRRFEYIRENHPSWGEVEGQTFPLSGKYENWELGVMIDLGPRFTVGLSTFLRPVKKYNEGSVSYTYYGYEATQKMTYTYQTEYRLLSPLEFTFYYRLFRLPGFNFSVGLGSGFYPAKISRRWIFDVLVSTSEEPYKFIQDINTRRGFFPALVCHLNLIADCSISSRVSLISEIKFRYGKISNFKGIETRWDNLQDVTREERGTLYYFTAEDLFLGVRYSNIEVWSFVPEGSIDGKSDIRKADLDLTGVSFRIGLKIGLF